MLLIAFKVPWRSYISNAEIYGVLPKATSKVQQKRMRHSIEHGDEVASKLVLWQLSERRRRRRRLTFVATVIDIETIQKLKAII